MARRNSSTTDAATSAGGESRSRLTSSSCSPRSVVPAVRSPHSGCSPRLLRARPSSKPLSPEANPAAAQTGRLLELLDRYGAQELRAAITEALERKTERASSVAYLLERRRRASKALKLPPVDLTRRPDLADFHVQPHSAETYDELSSQSDEPESD